MNGDEVSTPSDEQLMATIGAGRNSKRWAFGTSTTSTSNCIMLYHVPISKGVPVLKSISQALTEAENIRRVAE